MSKQFFKDASAWAKDMASELPGADAVRSFNAFKGIDGNLSNSLDTMKGGQKLSLGTHNSLLQLANTSGFGGSAAYGAGAGALYGAVDGAFSYDGSILGGAFHGAVLGSAGGAGLKFAANTYAKGAAELGTAKLGAGGYSNTWTSAFKMGDKQANAFQTSAFKGGW